MLAPAQARQSTQKTTGAEMKKKGKTCSASDVNPKPLVEDLVAEDPTLNTTR